MAKIDTLFRYLISSRGSDLHLSEGQVPKIRVHGAVTAIPEQEVLHGESFKQLLGEICDNKAFENYLEGGDLDFAYEMDEDSRFRCNYLQQQNGLAAVFRLIPTEIASLESLGVPEVVKEYKTGILDPARLVGKMEIKGARKK
jgi:twitching motility protein PilT